MYTEQSIIGLRVKHKNGPEEYTITHFEDGMGCTVAHNRGMAVDRRWFKIEQANTFIKDGTWIVVGGQQYEIY